MSEQQMTKRQRREQNKEMRMDAENSMQRSASLKKGLVAGGVVLGLIAIAFVLILVARGGDYALTMTEPSIGPEDAPVLIEEFADYQCPACQASYKALKSLVSQYPTQVRFVYNDFPLPIHDQAQKAARGVLCAGQQGKYWELHDAIFDQQTSWSTNGSDINDTFDGLVATQGLNKDDFDACYTSRNVRNAISEDLIEGQNRGVNSTPTFFVNGKKIQGGQSLFQWIQLVNEELSKKGLTPENSLNQDGNVDNQNQGAGTQENQ